MSQGNFSMKILHLQESQHMISMATSLFKIIKYPIMFKNNYFYVPMRSIYDVGQEVGLIRDPHILLKGIHV